MSEVAQNQGNLYPRAPLCIGPLQLDGCAVLAPMSGITDVGMRRIARRMGASLVVSEMVASDHYVRGEAETQLRAEGAGITPHVVQIAGCQPHGMAEAAKLAEASGADVVDINMGCPAKKVTGGLAGSALMRDPNLALSLIAATVKAVSIPVTLKMRLGWDHTCLNAPTLARAAQDLGVQLVTVHGRTRMQFYKGEADWAAIRAVRDAITIPLVANGDGQSLQDAQAMLAASGADGVMIGRGAVGRPWLVGQIAAGLAGRPVPTWDAATCLAAALEHYDTLLSIYGVASGLRHARKHLAAYAEHALAGLETDPATTQAARQRLVTSNDPAEVKALLTRLFLEAPTRIAA